MVRSKKYDKSATSSSDSNHPQENIMEHRQFLIRSLERNDKELAAIVTLNRSLKECRQSVVEQCGDLVLLDLGCGRLTLFQGELHEHKNPKEGAKAGTTRKSASVTSPPPSPDKSTGSGPPPETSQITTNDDDEKEKDDDATAVKEEAATAAPDSEEEEQRYALTPIQQSLCVDFLERMTLRRKLKNRLIRRLNRLAHAMDGVNTTVFQPPPPPRYGDLRLNLDPEAVKTHDELWMSREEAKKRVQAMRAMLGKQEGDDNETKENSAPVPPAPTNSATTLPAVKEDEVPVQAITSSSSSSGAKEEMDSTKKEEKEEDSSTQKEGKQKNDEAKPVEAPVASSSTKEEEKDATMEDANNDEASKTVKVQAVSTTAKESKEVEDVTMEDAETMPVAPKPSSETPTPTASTDADATTATGKPVSDEARDEEKKEAKPTPPKVKEETVESTTAPTSSATTSPAVDKKEDNNKEPSTAPNSEPPKGVVGDNQNQPSTAEPSKEKEADGQEASSEGGDAPMATTNGDTKAETDNTADDATTKQPDNDTTPPDTKMEEPVTSSEQPMAAVKNEEEMDPLMEAIEQLPQTPLTLQEELENLKEYSVAYEKVWDPTFSTFYYRIAKDDSHEDDYVKLTSGAGVGAQARLVHEQEREQEHKRWQAAILSKIPDQPTFADLGLKHRVFHLEERRKRCLESYGKTAADEGSKATTSATNDDDKAATGKTSPSKKRKKDQVDKADEMNDEGDDESKNGEDTSDPMEEDNEADKEKEAGGDEKADEQEPTKEAVNLEETKLVRPMSLACVPSFHEQDMRRIRTIHGDLMSQSIVHYTREKLEAATREYNGSLNRSNQLMQHRNRLTQNFNFFVQKSRAEMTKANQEYSMQLAMAKRQYLKEKQDHDRQKLKNTLPSRWGRRPFGTPFIQTFMANSTAPNAGVVASCLADVIDGAVLIIEGKVDGGKFKSFAPPPPPETEVQNHLRAEQELRRQVNEVTSKYQQNEEERKRSWRKYVKTASELDLPMSGQRRIDPNTPMPPLRNSTQQRLPRELGIPSSMASFTPSRGRPIYGSGPSSSKYSTARVQQRIHGDGTVAPVSQPKKTSDGLYQRPAGRTRKGMQWDAVRGIWVPET